MPVRVRIALRFFRREVGDRTGPVAVSNKLSQMSTLTAKLLSAKLAETEDEDGTENLLVEKMAAASSSS
jgi:hypothetical protein